MTRTYKTRTKNSNISSCVNFCEETFNSIGMKKKDYMLSLIQIEDVVAKCISSAYSEDDEIEIKIIKKLNHIYATIKCRGRGFKKDEIILPIVEQNANGFDDDESTNIVKRLLNKSYGSGIKYKRYGDTNKLFVDVNRNGANAIIYVLLAMVLGIIVGLIFKNFIPSTITNFVCNEIFDTIYELFIKIIMFIVGPLVFFSIASSFSSNDDLKTFGKIGTGVLKWFLIFSTIGVLIGTSLGFGFNLKDESLKETYQIEESIETDLVDSSIKESILEFFPDTIVEPFMFSNVMQVMILAIIVGICASKCTKYKKELQVFLDAGNELFSNAISALIIILPVVAFSSLASVVIKLDTELLFKLIGVVAITYLSIFLVMIISYIITGIKTRKNPIKIFRKTISALFTALASSSSCATMPESMRVCKEELGIDKKIYSFAIPLGATIDMAGSTASYSAALIFFILSFKLEITLPFLIYFYFVVIFFSAAEPATPGAGVVVSLAIITSIGLPSSLASLLILFSAFCDNAATTVNIMGDILSSFIVANKNNMIDEEIFNKEV